MPDLTPIHLNLIALKYRTWWEQGHSIYVRWSLTDDGVCYSLGFLECKIMY